MYSKIMLITGVILLFFLFCQWKIFVKAGEKGWAAIIPFYSSYVLSKITFGNGWMFLLSFVPIANVIFVILQNLKLAKAFGKGTGYGIGLIFLPIIFFPMLALGNSTTKGKDPMFGTVENDIDSMQVSEAQGSFDGNIPYSGREERTGNKLKGPGLLFFLNPKNLRYELKRCGFEITTTDYVKFLMICFAALVGFAFLFKLKIQYIAILAIAVAVFIPSIFFLQYKNLYEAAKFEEVTVYMEQMLYSFKKHPKILSSLQDTLVLFENDEQSTFRELIQKAIEHIQTGQTTGNIYREAFGIIEEEYGCKRLYKIHDFMIHVEEAGGQSADSVEILLLDRNLWMDRIYQLIQDKQKVKVNVAIAIGLSLVIVGMTTYMLPSSMGVTDSIPSQIVTTVSLFFDFVIYYVVQRILSKSLLAADQDTSFEEIRKSYNFVMHTDFNKYKKKYQILGLLFVIAAIPIYLFVGIKQALLVVVMGILVYSQPGRKRKASKKRVTKEIEKAFPEWLLALSLQLQSDNVHVSIAITIPDAPMVLREELEKFQDGIEKHPESIAPYADFMKDFHLSDIQSTMKMLYALSAFGSDDAQSQIRTLVERNTKIMDRGEKMKMEDQLAGVSFAMLLPMLTAVAKMMTDMIVMMISLLGNLTINM